MPVDLVHFSKREQTVIDLLMRGKSNKEIALSLGISVRTVEFHLGRIYARLQVASRAEAILSLSRMGLWESTVHVDPQNQGKSPVENVSETGHTQTKAPFNWRTTMKNLPKQIWENPWILFTIILSLIVVGFGFPVFLEKFGATAGVLLMLVLIGLVWATYFIRSKLFSGNEQVNQKDQIGESKEMNKMNINHSRFWVGITLTIVAVLIFVVFRETYSTAGAIAIGVLGLTSIAISRRKG